MCDAEFYVIKARSIGGAKITPTPRGWGLDMAAIRSQLRALVNDRNLRRFVVQARPTGRQLGTGSYGTVEEVTYVYKENY